MGFNQQLVDIYPYEEGRLKTEEGGRMVKPRECSKMSFFLQRPRCDALRTPM